MEAGWAEVKKLAYGPLGLKPAEFWELTMTELVEMAEAHGEYGRQKDEAEYYRTAWLAANLMNSTGNFKQHLTPEKLLGKNQQATGQTKPITVEERERQFNELLKKFNKT